MLTPCFPTVGVIDTDPVRKIKVNRALASNTSRNAIAQELMEVTDDNGPNVLTNDPQFFTKKNAIDAENQKNADATIELVGNYAAGGDAEPEAAAESEPESEPEKESQPDTKQPAIISKSATESQVQLNTNPSTEPEPESTAEPEPESTAEPEPESTAEPEPAAVVEPVGEEDDSVVEGAAEAIVIMSTLELFDSKSDATVEGSGGGGMGSVSGSGERPELVGEAGSGEVGQFVVDSKAGSNVLSGSSSQEATGERKSSQADILPDDSLELNM